MSHWTVHMETKTFISCTLSLSFRCLCFTSFISHASRRRIKTHVFDLMWCLKSYAPKKPIRTLKLHRDANSNMHTHVFVSDMFSLCLYFEGFDRHRQWEIPSGTERMTCTRVSWETQPSSVCASWETQPMCVNVCACERESVIIFVCVQSSICVFEWH